MEEVTLEEVETRGVRAKMAWKQNGELFWGKETRKRVRNRRIIKGGMS